MYIYIYIYIYVFKKEILNAHFVKTDIQIVFLSSFLAFIFIVSKTQYYVRSCQICKMKNKYSMTIFFCILLLHSVVQRVKWNWNRYSNVIAKFIFWKTEIVGGWFEIIGCAHMRPAFDIMPSTTHHKSWHCFLLWKIKTP